MGQVINDRFSMNGALAAMAVGSLSHSKSDVSDFEY
jgi:hypothetical protein